MKSVSIKKTLSAMALATLGLAAASAQADGWQGDIYRNAPYGQPEYREPARPVPAVVVPAPQPGFAMHEIREGFRLASIVNERQDAQMDKILAGVEADRLARAELVSLMREQKSIRDMERSFMKDRFLSQPEFQRLMQALDVAERDIQIALSNHDRRQRPWFWGR